MVCMMINNYGCGKKEINRIGNWEKNIITRNSLNKIYSCDFSSKIC